jgi:hypothetical protein
MTVATAVFLIRLKLIRSKKRSVRQRKERAMRLVLVRASKCSCSVLMIGVHESLLYFAGPRAHLRRT